MNTNIVYAPGVAFSKNEAVVLEFLAREHNWYGDVNVSRRSEREFDLSIDGAVGEIHDYKYEVAEQWADERGNLSTRMRKVPCAPYMHTHLFSAWLPLSALHYCWARNKLRRMFAPDYGTDDWSFVRDSGESTIWENFTRFFAYQFR